jgi:hypothetical protein
MSDEDAKKPLLGRLYDWLAAGSPQPMPPDIPESLPFISNAAAFDYACEFLICAIKVNTALPALVKRVTPHPRNPSLQLCNIKLAQRNGGIDVICTTLNNNVPTLNVGDLVLYKVAKFINLDAKSIDADSPLNIIGFVEAKLLPEFHLTKGWAIAHA